MSRLLRIIIFLIIVLLLIFSGFRCSQNIPNGSKATANFIEKNQPTKENTSTTNSETNKTTEITLPTDTDEASKNTELKDTTSHANKSATDSSVEEKANHSQPARTEQTKPTNDSDSSADTTENNQVQEKEHEKENDDTDKTTSTNTVAITAGSSVILKGVSFASGSNKLIKSSISILNEVAKTLKEKSTLHIEVAGYTDNQGNAAANTKLSQLRADQVKAHLVAQDIQAKRISTKGYGASSPIASNKTEIGREQNRRVEIHVK